MTFPKPTLLLIMSLFTAKEVSPCAGGAPDALLSDHVPVTQSSWSSGWQNAWPMEAEAQHLLGDTTGDTGVLSYRICFEPVTVLPEFMGLGTEGQQPGISGC